jgi:hypothetical protein
MHERRHATVLTRAGTHRQQTTHRKASTLRIAEQHSMLVYIDNGRTQSDNAVCRHTETQPRTQLKPHTKTILNKE